MINLMLIVNPFINHLKVDDEDFHLFKHAIYDKCCHIILLFSNRLILILNISDFIIN